MTQQDENVLEQLEGERQRAITEVQQIQAQLGLPVPHYLRHGQKNARRETLKARLADAHRRLRTANQALRQARRAGQLVLVYGVDRPADVRELVASLYRMFADAVPEVERTEQQQALCHIARDYVQTGRIG